MATTKTIPKLGATWPWCWNVSGSSMTPLMPPGYPTFSDLAIHAAANGISIVTLRLSGGDHPSHRPQFEVRPGEFNWGSETISRDGNGDIISTLYSKTDSVPASSNVKKMLDACYDNDIKVLVQLESHYNLATLFDYHCYKLNRINAHDNIEALGIAGVLTAYTQMYTNSTAEGWYKDRLDCWLNGFGDHDAVYGIDLGNEIMFASNESDLQDWVDEMSTYLWSQYGSKKPFITVSRDDQPWSDSKNAAFDRLEGGARMVTFHQYSDGVTSGNALTLAGLTDNIDDALADGFNTFSYGGETKKWWYRIGEDKGWGAGPNKTVDPSITDINIQGDPVTKTYAYEEPEPDDTISPYPHERMHAFLAMVLDPTFHYTRWTGEIDGWSGAGYPTIPRCAEIMKVAKDFYDNCPFDELLMTRHEDNVSSSGALDFKCSLLWPDVSLTFVLVGSGVQTIDFGVTGDWNLITYKWEGDGSDDWERVIDDVEIDPSGYSLDFGDYTDGFAPGFLLPVAGPPPIPPVPSATIPILPLQSILPLPSHELWLTDDFGARIAQVTTFDEVSASRVVDGIGWINVVLDADFDTSLIKPDRMFQFWRAPRGGTLGLWRVYFIRRWRWQTTGSDEVLIVSGPDTNDLLRRRIVAGYSGSSQAHKEDFADDMMKEFVTEALSDANDPTPDAGTRAWSDLSVAADLSNGPTLTKNANWGRLLQPSGGGLLADLAKASREAGTEVFFDIVPKVVSGSSITFEFQTYTGQPGQDVSSKVVFGRDEENLEDPFLEYDYSEETNYVYAGGQGEGEARNIQQVYDSDRYLISQWNRCELFADARQQTTDDGVREKGRSVLEAGRPKRKLGGMPIDTAGTRFGIDWDFGYKVKAKYREEEFNSIIRSVVIRVVPGEEEIQARLDYES